MSTATYSVTMAELKEPPHGNMWAANYGMATSRFGHHSMDAGSMPSPAAAAQQQQHAARPRNASMDHHQPQHHPYSYGRYSHDDAADAYDRQQHQVHHHHQQPTPPQHHHHQQQQQQQQHQQPPQQLHHPSLTAHHSFPNLKRPYSHTEQPPYTEMVQDLRDDGSKLSVNHDHKLLSFKRSQDKLTILDQHGRIQQLDLTAQLHGMFFLSEMPASAADGSILQPELTCYRRNLFQISGSLVTPRGQLSVITESGETVPVSSNEVTISAIESVDGHPVRLIVIPWKTPPPNSPELSQGPDQEPPSLPLIPFQDDGQSEVDGDFAVYPIGWRRLQFRIATANNGRRKELQQHFVLHLKVISTLANGSKVVLTEATTAPIVVRGRSPRNFQARKEIPLLGSSAGSRGQALVETGLGIVAGPLAMKPQDKSRSLNLELPRSAFTFTSAGPKMPTSPMTMRSNSYPTTWNPPHVQQGPGGYPSTTMSADPYPQKLPLSGASTFTAEPQEMAQQTSMPAMQLSLAAPDHQHQSQQPPPIRTQYAYVPTGGSSVPPPQLSIATAADSNGLSVPRYVDSNPRPSKSPRHASHQSVGSITNTESSPEYRYGPPAPYVGAGNASSSSDLSPHSQHPPSAPYGAAPSASASSGAAGTSQQPHDNSSGGGQSGNGAAGGSNSGGNGAAAGPNPSSAPNSQPPRDYFPPSTSWTTTAGEAPTTTSSVSYTNGDSRPYVYPDYKGTSKPEHHAAPSQPAFPPPRGTFDNMNHYSWNTT